MILSGDAQCFSEIPGFENFNLTIQPKQQLTQTIAKQCMVIGE